MNIPKKKKKNYSMLVVDPTLNIYIYIYIYIWELFAKLTNNINSIFIQHRKFNITLRNKHTLKMSQ